MKGPRKTSEYILLLFASPAQRNQEPGHSELAVELMRRVLYQADSLFLFSRERRASCCAYGQLQGEALLAGVPWPASGSMGQCLYEARTLDDYQGSAT